MQLYNPLCRLFHFSVSPSGRYVHPSIHLFGWPAGRLSVHLSVHLSVRPSVRPSICLSVRLSVPENELSRLSSHRQSRFLTVHSVAWYVHLLAPLTPPHLPRLLAPFTSSLTLWKSSLTPLTISWDTEIYRYVFVLKTHSTCITRKRKHALTRPAWFQNVPVIVTWNIGWREIGWDLEKRSK